MFVHTSKDIFFSLFFSNSDKMYWKIILNKKKNPFLGGGEFLIRFSFAPCPSKNLTVTFYGCI